jgi:hypothetical protein
MTLSTIKYDIPKILSGKSNVAEFTGVKRRCDNPQNCRIQVANSWTTCAYYPPVYDGFGNNLNPDRNQTTTGQWRS